MITYRRLHTVTGEAENMGAAQCAMSAVPAVRNNETCVSYWQIKQARFISKHGYRFYWATWIQSTDDILCRNIKKHVWESGTVTNQLSQKAFDLTETHCATRCLNSVACTKGTSCVMRFLLTVLWKKQMHYYHQRLSTFFRIRHQKGFNKTTKEGLELNGTHRLLFMILTDCVWRWAQKLLADRLRRLVDTRTRRKLEYHVSLPQRTTKIKHTFSYFARTASGWTENK
jgi:hypothetical protein